jgi:hypothetical protein
VPVVAELLMDADKVTSAKAMAVLDGILCSYAGLQSARACTWFIGASLCQTRPRSSPSPRSGASAAPRTPAMASAAPRRCRCFCSRSGGGHGRLGRGNHHRLAAAEAPVETAGGTRLKAECQTRSARRDSAGTLCASTAAPIRTLVSDAQWRVP